MIPPGFVWVPRYVDTSAGNLFWDFNFRHKAITPRMLNTFSELHRLDDSAILSFAKQWGVLGLCVHGLPASHLDVMSGKSYGAPHCDFIESGRSDLTLQEPIAKWRKWSSCADAIMQIAATLRVNEMPEGALWERLLFQRRRILGVTFDPKLKPSKQNQSAFAWARDIFQSEINDWLNIGHVGPRVMPNKQRQLEMVMLANSVPNLFGSIGIALAMTACGNNGLKICSACGGWHVPNRMPNEDRNTFCNKCRGSKTQWALLQRQRRARIKREED